MKERWKEMLEYQQKVQAMTDLERAQWAIRGEPETWIPMIVMHLAAARREAIEQAKDDIAQLKGDIEEWRGKLAEQCGKTLAAAHERQNRIEDVLRSYGWEGAVWCIRAERVLIEGDGPIADSWGP